MNISPWQKLNTSLLVLAMTVVFIPAFSFAGSTLVIDEFRVSAEDTNDEYVALANYGTAPVDLNGYRLIKRTSTATEYKLYEFVDSYLLNPEQKIILAHDEYTGVSDFTFTANTIADNNSVYLLAPDNSVVDMVGYGDATYFEKSPIPAPEANEVYARVNGIDTNDNSADFELQEVVIEIDINAGNLVISELLPSPDTGEEWFELYNSTNRDISLKNLKICDALGRTHCYYFNDSDHILAGNYKVYFQSLTKITLNNNGDWLELYDIADNMLSESGGNYNAADKGVSLSLFGSEYMWTQAKTPASENIFIDTVELEDEPVVKPKTTKTRVVKATKKTMVNTSGDEREEVPAVETAVKSVETSSPIVAVQKALVNKDVLGWGLIVLAFLLLLSYTCWYFKDYAKDIYNKIRHGDDSARF